MNEGATGDGWKYMYRLPYTSSIGKNIPQNCEQHNKMKGGPPNGQNSSRSTVQGIHRKGRLKTVLFSSLLMTMVLCSLP
jgi:hypothetical protein